MAERRVTSRGWLDEGASKSDGFQSRECERLRQVLPNPRLDSAGNPTTWKGAGQSFNADNQRSATGYAFDGNGNPTTYAGATLAFDPMDKAISIGGSGTLSARYRSDGLRAWKGYNVSIPTSGGTPVTNATYFLYDRGNPVVEMDSSGSVTAVNVFADDGLVARKVSSTWTYYQFDPQGSVAQRTNASGSVTSSSMYDAYGKHVTIPGSVTDVYAWNGRWGYYSDSETGLILCQQRFYDANQGRWLNQVLRLVRALRDLGRYSPSAGVQDACQLNVGGQQATLSTSLMAD